MQVCMRTRRGTCRKWQRMSLDSSAYLWKRPTRSGDAAQEVRRLGACTNLAEEVLEVISRGGIARPGMCRPLVRTNQS